MFTIDLPKHPVFGEAVVAPHPPSGTYRARLIYMQPESLAHRLPLDEAGQIIYPVIEDRNIKNLIERLRRRVGDFDVDPALIEATLNWIPLGDNR